MNKGSIDIKTYIYIYIFIMNIFIYILSFQKGKLTDNFGIYCNYRIPSSHKNVNYDESDIL